MSSTMKISLLALVSTVAAVPQYGYGHAKFHSLKPSGTQGYSYGEGQGQETAPAYPQGGYPTGVPHYHGHHNHTHVPHATDSYEVVDITKTRTTTIVTTIHVQPSPTETYEAVVKDVSTDEYEMCGPATVTVTASEVHTVTVEDSYNAPSSAPAYVASSAYVAPVESSAYVAVPPSSAAPAEGGYTPKPAEPTSSKEVVPVYTSAAPTPSTPATQPYSGNKRGLAYNDAALLKNLGGKYGFAVNWGQVENADIGIMYIPMMHKPSDSTPEAWLANVDKAAKKGSTAVMGFNECDIASQCNMSPADTCAQWKNYMNPIKQKYPNMSILGPAVSNGPSDQGMGLGWLSQFKDTCGDAAYDATNIHFYDNYDADTINRFKAQVEKAIALYNKPVWITEFGLNPGYSQDQAASFLKECLDYLDSNDMVHGYSWFMVGTDQSMYELCDASGSGLSKVGQVYAAGM